MPNHAADHLGKPEELPHQRACATCNAPLPSLDEYHSAWCQKCSFSGIKHTTPCPKWQMNRIDLDALLNFLTLKRQHGNTIAAIEGVSNTPNATLVCATQDQARALNRGGRKYLAASIAEVVQATRNLGAIPGDPRPVVFDLFLVELIASQAKADEAIISEMMKAVPKGLIPSDRPDQMPMVVREMVRDLRNAEARAEKSETEIEAQRLRLCRAGLVPSRHLTLADAVDGALAIVKVLREHLADPPADVQVAVLEKLRRQDLWQQRIERKHLAPPSEWQVRAEKAEAILAELMTLVPFGNLKTHTRENLPGRVQDFLAELVEMTSRTEKAEALADAGLFIVRSGKHGCVEEEWDEDGPVFTEWVYEVYQHGWGNADEHLGIFDSYEEAVNAADGHRRTR